MKSTNPVWNLFASVKLALFTLGCLAVTSIAGTVIPQKETMEFYVDRYGTKSAQYLQLLDITDMYTSWWFLSLLTLLTINLLVCSADRFPGVWRQMTRDNLGVPLDSIEKNRLSVSLMSPLPPHGAKEKVRALLSEHGWKPQLREREEVFLFFSEKMPWSRMGVYFVHLSILVIFAGAGYGQLTGFKGSIMLPELQGSTIIYPHENGEPIDLGFEVRCERFDIEFYSNQMPKEFTSKLTILDGGEVVLQKDIEVNDPLKYKGITFYQSSYRGFRDFVFTLAEEDSATTTITGDYQKELAWSEKGVHFGIINLEAIGDRVVRLKIWLRDDKGEPSQFWMKAGETVSIERPDTTYLFSAKQRYATGLQVARDPGVWVVYFGCGLMLLGLYMAFFLSHGRIWLILRKHNEGTVIDLKGTTNKNKEAFDAKFQTLAELLKTNI
jgi:cytochrome c biogenesis protein